MHFNLREIHCQALLFKTLQSAATRSLSEVILSVQHCYQASHLNVRKLCPKQNNYLPMWFPVSGVSEERGLFWGNNDVIIYCELCSIMRLIIWTI